MLPQRFSLLFVLIWLDLLPKTSTSSEEETDEGDEEAAQALLRRVNTLPRLLDAPSFENMHAEVVSCGARHSAVITDCSGKSSPNRLFSGAHFSVLKGCSELGTSRRT